MEPVRGVVPLNLHELLEYRELIWFLLLRDLKVRYRQMALGPLWIVLSPLLNMVLFSVIFGKMAKMPSDGVPYPLFSYAALLPWAFFASSLTTAANSLLGYKDLIAKIYFPRLIIPLVGVLSALCDLLISLLILFGMMLFYGYWPGVGILMLPVYLLLGAMTALGVGLWWAAWIVHYRDLNTVLGYVVRVWMFAAPVVYGMSMIPVKWQTLYRLNPMANMIEGFRWSLLNVGTPKLGMTLLAFFLSAVLLLTGAYHFRRTERNIIDIA